MFLELVGLKFKRVINFRTIRSLPNDDARIIDMPSEARGPRPAETSQINYRIEAHSFISAVRA
jgi:hypothetical protein